MWWDATVQELWNWAVDRSGVWVSRMMGLASRPKDIFMDIEEFIWNFTLYLAVLRT